MLILIALLFSAAFLLMLLAVQALAGGSNAATISRRLQATALADAGAGSPRPAWVRRRLRDGVIAFGTRLTASRPNLEALRDTLIQAGYRSPAAVPTWFAVRMLVMLGMAAMLLALVPLAGLSAGTAVLVLPYVLLPGWLLPRMWLKARVRARQKSIRRALPDVLDLLVVCVEAGLGLNQALVRVALEIRPVSLEMAAELRMLNLEIQAGTARAEAFRNLGRRTGVEDVQALATMLIQADKFGTSIAQALRVQCDSLRTKRRQRAEEEAAKTTIKLVFPLVFFIFPALFVVILGPALISVLKAMG